MKNEIIFCVVISAVLFGCMPTYILHDGITKVPVSPDVYENKVKFNQSLLNQIDTSVVYEKSFVDKAFYKNSYGTYLRRYRCILF